MFIFSLFSLNFLLLYFFGFFCLCTSFAFFSFFSFFRFFTSFPFSSYFLTNFISLSTSFLFLITSFPFELSFLTTFFSPFHFFCLPTYLAFSLLLPFHCFSVTTSVPFHFFSFSPSFSFPLPLLFLVHVCSFSSFLSVFLFFYLKFFHLIIFLFELLAI